MSETAVGIQIAQIYLLSASFGYRVNPLSVPHDAKIQPQEIGLSVGLETLQATTGGKEAFQVRLRVISNPEDEKALYNFDIEIACLVNQVDQAKFPPQKLVQVAVSWLFPFLRETVANMTMRGRFGPVWLKPIDVTTLVPPGGPFDQPNQEAERDMEPATGK